ncbi:hypothetical protein LY76DRAFT_278807 [Colletotrichum caudatum]|nr:hypothetical protein LY76DRAFT_278807 [Colletotrichum caudatum]
MQLHSRQEANRPGILQIEQGNLCFGHPTTARKEDDHGPEDDPGRKSKGRISSPRVFRCPFLTNPVERLQQQTMRSHVLRTGGRRARDPGALIPSRLLRNQRYGKRNSIPTAISVFGLGATTSPASWERGGGAFRFRLKRGALPPPRLSAASAMVALAIPRAECRPHHHALRGPRPHSGRRYGCPPPPAGARRGTPAPSLERCTPLLGPGLGASPARPEQGRVERDGTGPSPKRAPSRKSRLPYLGCRSRPARNLGSCVYVCEVVSFFFSPPRHAQ